MAVIVWRRRIKRGIAEINKPEIGALVAAKGVK